MKQLAAFIDLLGFNHYYDIIKRQNKMSGQEMASRAVGKLYRSYMERLRAAINRPFEKVMKGIDGGSQYFDEEFKQGLRKANVLAISDSIIIAITCQNKHVVPTYLALSNALISLISETMKADYMPDEIKKYNFSIFCPVRGGITYNYSEIDLHGEVPIVYGLAYQEAYKMEKSAGWPRIVIDKQLASILLENSLSRISLAETNQEEFGAYFDILKLQYHFIQKFHQPEDRQELVKHFAIQYKKYIELNARFASMLCAYEYDDKKKLFRKYREWADYYNERIDWLIQNDPITGETARTLSIEMKLLDQIFQNHTYAL